MRPAKLLVCAPTILAVLLLGCGRSGGAPAAVEKPSERVVTAPVQRGAVVVWVDVTGSVAADERVRVASKVQGRVLEVGADLGDRVEPGSVLVRLDDRDYRIALTQRERALSETLAQLGLTSVPDAGFDIAGLARVRSARAESANADAKQARIDELRGRDAGAFSAQEYEDVRTAADVARAAVEVAELEARALLATVQARVADVQRAQRDLEETVVRVPHVPGVGAGTLGVAARSIAVGDLVSVGSALVELVKDDPVRFVAKVPERHASQVRVGQPVQVQTDASAAPLLGVVKRVSPVVEVENRTFEVQVEVPNPGRAVKPGSFARGRIAVGEQADALFVPEAAVVTFAGVRKVFSVKEGTAVEHAVETGERRDGLVQVRTALPGVEAVVTKGAERLTRGVPVVVVGEGGAGGAESGPGGGGGG